MSITKNKKWSRLLFTFLIVVALGLSMLPAAVFAADPCDPHSDECGIQVNIVLPGDNAQVSKGDCFWVNAVVTRSYAAGEITGVSATLVIDSPGAQITPCNPDDPPCVSETQDGADLTNSNTLDDFWWKVCCTDYGTVQYHVDAEGTGCGSTVRGTDSAKIIQVAPECAPCLVIDIIECGPEDVQGTEVPATVNQTVYAVKATITNVCDQMICGITADISWSPESGALLLTPTETEIPDVGCIYPGRSEEVGWTFICTSPEDVVFTVTADYVPPPIPQLPPYCYDPCEEQTGPSYCDLTPTIGHYEGEGEDRHVVVGPATCSVDQICFGTLKVTLNDLPDKVCSSCGSQFIVTADICELCDDTGVDAVQATINITGPGQLAQIGTNPKTQDVMNSANLTCNNLGPLDCGHVVTWYVDVIGPGPITVSVTATGNDARTGLPTSTTSAIQTVQGRDDLTVVITSPDPDETFNVCDTYDLTFTVKNCDLYNAQNNVQVTVNLTGAANVAFNGDLEATATAGTCAGTCPTGPVTLDNWRLADGIAYFTIPRIGSCCCVDVTIPLACTGSGVENCGDPADENIIVSVWPSGVNVSQVPAEDVDSVIVHQMYKAHLTSNVAVYEGLMDGEADTFEGCEPICAIVAGESYTVVAVVANQGEATAKSVNVTLSVNGPALLLSGSLTQTIREIGCHGAAKVMWQFTCIGEGPVTFAVCDITGTDENTGVAIHGSNIELPSCTLVLQQIPIQIEIIQPITSTDFIENESFTVKAKVTNVSSYYSINQTMLTLRWFTEDEGCDECAGDFSLSPTSPKTVNVTPLLPLGPGQSAFATWNVKCCGAGDVSFWIDVDAVTVFDNARSIKGGCGMDISSTINTIHQWEKGGISCYILSPKLKDFDVCHEYGDPEAYIATGQEFSVSAKLMNFSDLPFAVDSIELMADGWGYFSGAASVVGTSFGDLSVSPIILAAHGQEGDTTVVSFDVVCTESGKTDIVLKASGATVTPDQSVGVSDSCMSYVTIMQYEAAHLVVNIQSSYPDPIDLGSEFLITATVTNIGEADAWEVGAQISVFPATSAEVSYNDQYGSYTRDLDNLTGHGVNESATVTWLMRCKAVCDTTITVTAWGYDEAGYEVKQICTSEIVPTPVGPFQATCCELLLDGTPGAPIPSRFIEPASITVKQQDPANPDPQEPTGNFDLILYPGWNLVSSPWYLSNTDPAVVFAAAGSRITRIATYDRDTSSWLSYNFGGPGDLTEFRDGPGYWVFVTEGDPITIAIYDEAEGGPDFEFPTYAVNYIGYSLVGPRIGETTPTTASQWLTPLTFAVIYGYDAQLGAYYQVQGTTLVQPGQGYWVAFTSTGDRYQ